MEKIIIQSEWYEKGLDYALISWTSTFNRMGKPNPYSRIEKILIGIIAESSVENYLLSNNIKYSESGKTRWYEIDRYDIGIGKHEIDVKSNFLNLTSPYIQQLFSRERDKLRWLQTCIALVPLDQFNPSKTERLKKKKNKVFLFPFMEGYFQEDEMAKNLVHAFWDYKWLKRAEHRDLGSLGKLNITYDGSLNKNHKIIIYGTSAPKAIIKEEIILNKQMITTSTSYHQVFAIRFVGKPNGSLTVKSITQKLSEVIRDVCGFALIKDPESGKYVPSQNDWQDLTLYSSNIFLSGWITEDEMRLFGKKYQRFDKTIPQYSEIKVDNWGCAVSELEKMSNIKKLS